MAIEKLALPHFVKFNLRRTAFLASLDFVPLEWQKLTDPLPFQASLCLTLIFLSEVVIDNFQNSFCSNT